MGDITTEEKDAETTSRARGAQRQKRIECHCSMVFSFMTMTHHGINVQPKRKKQPLTLDRDPVS